MINNKQGVDGCSIHLCHFSQVSVVNFFHAETYEEIPGQFSRSGIFGMFGGKCRTIMAHCVYSGEAEIRRMKENGVFIAHCPESNTNLSSGVAPVRRYLEEALRDMEKNRVKFRFFGDLTRLSPELQTLCHDAESRSEDYDVQVNFCLNYGGRDEIIHAVKVYTADVAAGRANPETLTEDVFSRYLYSAGVPDPELIIRPSGEMRVSNFLLWQSAYSEYVIMNVLWPDFTPEHLDSAIEEFHRRSRRFGGT